MPSSDAEISSLIENVGEPLTKRLWAEVCCLPPEAALAAIGLMRCLEHEVISAIRANVSWAQLKSSLTQLSHMSYEKLFAQASPYISSDQVFRQLMMRATTRHGEKFRPSFSEVSAMIALGEHGPLSGFVRRRGKEAHDFARGLLILQRYRNELLHETQPVIDRALSWLPVWQECLTISLNWKLSGPREVAEESVKGHRRSVA